MGIPDHSALSRIGQIAINAHDVARATASYRDVPGMRHLFRAGQLSFLDCGDVRLTLDKPEKAELAHPSSILYLQLGDAQAGFQGLKSAGAHFEDELRVNASLPKHNPGMAYFRDTEGNLIALVSEAAHAA